MLGDHGREVTLANRNSESIIEDIMHMWEADDPNNFARTLSGSRATVGEVETALDGAARDVARTGRSSLRSAISLMMISAALYDFLGKTVYMLVPGEDSGLAGLRVNKWLTMLCTFGSFIACAVPPTMVKSNREAVSEFMSLEFATKIIAPSVLDLLITGLRFVALVFLPPAVVSILKSSVQLLTLSFINRLRGKCLNNVQWISLGGALVGDAIISLADTLWHEDNPDSQGNSNSQLVGIVIVVMSGVLGAFRNAVEEMILNELDFPDGALLMVESWISAVLILIVFVAIGLVVQFHDMDKTFNYVVTDLRVAFCFILFLITSWGKDAGKFKVIKHSSSMVAKVLALLAPFGTWICSLCGYYGTYWATTTIGEPWENPASWVRFSGFFVIIVSGIVFVKQKKK
eukprot:TRINITY_DN23423_c0_g1_i1.p1 TRINITY_DN23423_c0_g1~~TRINITY_DN23423_c0_g1_i1.p1  ORF type:complete len:403 (-),score=50.35 TRINITY_DN23423_c0_g1_i1:108-1316(-)